MRFKPYIGLTIVTAICLAILISLGTWQLQRLSWKTQLISDIDAAAQSAPLGSVSDIERAISDGEPVDFRRINIDGRYISDAAFHVFRVDGKATKWRLFRPLKDSAGGPVYVSTALIDDAVKDIYAPQMQPQVFISGYVRTYQKPSRFVASSTPQANRWFSFNAAPQKLNWATAINGAVMPTAFYIDAVSFDAQPYTGDLPVKKPDLPNNHFDYMLTWYSFALILFVIYILLHIRGNRLTFGKK